MKSLLLDNFLLKQAEIRKKNPTKEEKMEGNSNPQRTVKLNYYGIDLGYTINFQGKKKSHHAEERQPYQQPIHLHVSSTNKVTLLRPKETPLQMLMITAKAHIS